MQSAQSACSSEASGTSLSGLFGSISVLGCKKVSPRSFLDPLKASCLVFCEINRRRKPRSNLGMVLCRHRRHFCLRLSASSVNEKLQKVPAGDGFDTSNLRGASEYATASLLPDASQQLPRKFTHVPTQGWMNASLRNLVAAAPGAFPSTPGHCGLLLTLTTWFSCFSHHRSCSLLTSVSANDYARLIRKDSAHSIRIGWLSEAKTIESTTPVKATADKAN